MHQTTQQGAAPANTRDIAAVFRGYKERRISSPFDNPSTILSEVEGSGQEAQEHRPAIPERP